MGMSVTRPVTLTSTSCMTEESGQMEDTLSTRLYRRVLLPA